MLWDRGKYLLPLYYTDAFLLSSHVPSSALQSTRQFTMDENDLNSTASRHKLAAVISWPPSPNLEIATNLKAAIVNDPLLLQLCFLFVLNTVQRRICLFGPIKLVVANL